MISELIQVLQRLPSLTEAHALVNANPGCRYWLVGNGGSAAVASHIANDMVRKGRRAIALVDPPTLSANANDFGWTASFAPQLQVHLVKGDLVIVISSSGQSANVIAATAAARDLRARVLTLSAFDSNNPLRGRGDVNLWVDTHNYGVAEAAHLAMLHEIVNP